MFAAGAPDSWTYVLGLEVTGPGGTALAVDAAWLEALLEEYYRGLCASVGAGRGLDLDLERVSASVQGGGASFTAAVELLDPFGSGAPLALALELLVHPDPGGGPGVQVLGLASPAASDSAVWNELRALGAAWRAERPVPVFLNHVYMVPDLATYEALRDSEFLREFALFEQRTTRRGDLTYTGLYLYGERTYFEFLKPDAALGFPQGGSGVAFGVELPGGLARIADALSGSGVQSFAGQVTRELDGRQVPWFDILGIQAATTAQRLQLFAMEYDPRFLARWHPREGQAAGRIDRAAVLDRYAEVLGRPADPLLADVAEVQLRLEREEHDHLLLVARAFGMGREPAQDSSLEIRTGSETRTGPGYELAAEHSGERPACDLILRGRLRRSVDQRDLRFGQVQLLVSGDRFSLFFEGLPAEETKQ
jgi:hypothetical protein